MNINNHNTTTLRKNINLSTEKKVIIINNSNSNIVLVKIG